MPKLWKDSLLDRIIENTVKNLKKHFFEVKVFNDTESIKKEIKLLLNKYESFAFGGSMTLEETGIKDFIIANGKKYIERNNSASEEENIESERRALLSDIYFCSANAISSDGALINIDKRGNRVGAMIFGPRKVIIIAGTNKIVETTDLALKRAKNIASVKNCIRFNLDTPCVKMQRCVDCEDEKSICYTTTIIKRSFPQKRISIFLIDKTYGF